MAKKTPAQLDREIAESIAFWKSKGRSETPTSFPKTLRHGGYTATFQGIQDPGTPQATATWEIKHGRDVVGTMHEGWSYGWGRPTISTRKLTWAGPLPPGTSDPRSPYYGWAFDLGPFDSYKEAMTKFAEHADRLIAWRKKHGKVVAQGVR